MIRDLRAWFNSHYNAEKYRELLGWLDAKVGAHVEFRVAETPIFLPEETLTEMAKAGAELAESLLGNEEYLSKARQAIPAPYLVAGETAHPNFLTVDFALVKLPEGGYAPRLVELQAFPSVFAYQALLCQGYHEVFGLSDTLAHFLGGLSEEDFWQLFRKTVLGDHAAEHVVLTEVEPERQKTLPDFLVTAQRLGIAVVDIAGLVPVGNHLYYRDRAGDLVRIDRIYNRAIADELMGKGIELPFDLTHAWEVEWAGHPNWYFLMSKFSIPWLSEAGFAVVPPAAFLEDFLAGPGQERLKAAGVALPEERDAETVFEQLLLKPLFSFAGKGIRFEPTLAEMEAIAPEDRAGYLVQQRMRFAHTVETPDGLTQAEIRILYLWPDGGQLTAALSLVRLGRGRMMGVDHNRDQGWVGASAAFYPTTNTTNTTQA